MTLRFCCYGTINMSGPPSAVTLLTCLGSRHMKLDMSGLYIKETINRPSLKAKPHQLHLEDPAIDSCIRLITVLDDP